MPRHGASDLLSSFLVGGDFASCYGTKKPKSTIFTHAAVGGTRAGPSSGKCQTCNYQMTEHFAAEPDAMETNCCQRPKGVQETGDAAPNPKPKAPDGAFQQKTAFRSADEGATDERTTPEAEGRGAHLHDQPGTASASPEPEAAAGGAPTPTPAPPPPPEGEAASRQPDEEGTPPSGARPRAEPEEAHVKSETKETTSAPAAETLSEEEQQEAKEDLMQVAAFLPDYDPDFARFDDHYCRSGFQIMHTREGPDVERVPIGCPCKPGVSTCALLGKIGDKRREQGSCAPFWVGQPSSGFEGQLDKDIQEEQQYGEGVAAEDKKNWPKIKGMGQQLIVRGQLEGAPSMYGFHLFRTHPTKQKERYYTGRCRSLDSSRGETQGQAMVARRLAVFDADRIQKACKLKEEEGHKILFQNPANGEWEPACKIGDYPWVRKTERPWLQLSKEPSKEHEWPSRSPWFQLDDVDYRADHESKVAGVNKLDHDALKKMLQDYMAKGGFKSNIGYTNKKTVAWMWDLVRNNKNEKEGEIYKLQPCDTGPPDPKSTPTQFSCGSGLE